MLLSEVIARGERVSLRRISAVDLEAVSRHEFSVSIVEPHGDVDRLNELHAANNFWLDEAKAVAMVNTSDGRLLGTLQSYRSSPCIHGTEIGYVIHNEADRGHGFAADALKLFSVFLFDDQPNVVRQQLLISVSNPASWKTAERAEFVREGVLRSSGFDDPPDDCFVYSKLRGD